MMYEPRVPVTTVSYRGLFTHGLFTNLCTAGISSNVKRKNVSYSSPSKVITKIRVNSDYLLGYIWDGIPEGKVAALYRFR